MIRYNNFHGYGMVIDEKPRILSKDGEIISVTFHLAVLRADRKVEDGRAVNQPDFIMIICRDRECCEKAKELTMYDMVEVQGFVRTSQRIKKTYFCPACGGATVREGSITYVLGIFCARRGHVEDKEQGLNDLIDNRAVSNAVFAHARLVCDPKMGRTKSGILVTQYQVAIGRAYYDPSDNQDKSDYVVVRSYGKAAQSDNMYLKKGSEIFIDGYVQARVAMLTIHCQAPAKDPFTGKPIIETDPVTGRPVMDPVTGELRVTPCGETYRWRQEVCEIVIYRPDYISGYKTQEEVEADNPQLTS